MQGAKAAARIAALKGEMDKVLPSSTPPERDNRFAAHAAHNFAEQLRRRRNDASHTAPTYGFEDREEAGSYSSRRVDTCRISGWCGMIFPRSQ